MNEGVITGTEIKKTMEELDIIGLVDHWKSLNKMAGHWRVLSKGMISFELCFDRID